MGRGRSKMTWNAIVKTIMNLLNFIEHDPRHGEKEFMWPTTYSPWQIEWEKGFYVGDPD